MALSRCASALCHSKQRTWSILQKAYSSNFTIPDKCYIDGQWVPSESGKVFDVLNPFNDAVIGQVPDCTRADTELAIAAAKNAFPKWKKSTVKERSGILRKAYELFHKHSKEFSELVTDEGGKVSTQAQGEIVYGASYFEWYAEEIKRPHGEILSPLVRDRKSMILREPAGVAAIITPWNFPNAMIARKVSAAIAAGCTCVLKPSEDTPYTALAIVKLLEESGVPPGVINIVTASRESAPPIGETFTKSPDVRVMSFTGSTAVGKTLMEQSASTVKKVNMELGGNAPFIVFESADLDKAVKGAMASKFRHSGQTCICSNRFLVQENVHDEFVEKLLNEMKKSVIIGDPNDERTTIGPLINRKAVDKVSRHVSDACNKGGELIIGGKVHNSSPNCYEPTVITGANHSMLACQEEIFGPVIAIGKFKTEEEAVHLANIPRTGLGGYFFSEDHQQLWRVAHELNVGMVAANEGIFSSPEVPHGGVKESGVGREGSKYGLDDYSDLKFVCFGGLSL